MLSLGKADPRRFAAIVKDAKSAPIGIVAQSTARPMLARVERRVRFMSTSRAQGE
jgi:hypothetical protein